MTTDSFRGALLRHACDNRELLRFALAASVTVVLLMAFWLPSYGAETATGFIVRVNIGSAVVFGTVAAYLLRRCVNANNAGDEQEADLERVKHSHRRYKR